MKDQKIVITGGLGYIGTELCKLYSGHARSNEIVVIDNRFISERVKQLCEWGINFVQCDITDRPALLKVMHGVNTVHHLAGVTDVAYTKTQSTEELDERIRKIGIDGTANVLSCMKEVGAAHAVIVFPSTHVVFEGVANHIDDVFDIREESPTYPELTYSAVKRDNEEQIKNSGLQYVILRLGSCYGYSTDTMRIGIMPNLFSKIASQGGTIQLFAGGIQWKSLVNVLDVARCFEFMASNPTAYNEIYHCVNEQMTVADVANICKSASSKVTVIPTTDEIPNTGYTLSKEKLLETGFVFHHRVIDSIVEMINNWSILSKQLAYKFSGANIYTDSRGTIKNYELPEAINMVGVIDSVRGSVRANHYHPIQEQKCILLKGQYIGVHKDLADTHAVVRTQLINAGDCEVISPNVAHAMVFTQDSLFINLVRGERDHENYGVGHTIPYILVTEELRDILLDSYKTNCRVCDGTNLIPYVHLGLSPLANSLVNSDTSDTPMYPLEVNYCADCHNSQLSCAVSPNLMFDHYLYTSSTTETFRTHFQNAADLYVDMFGLTDQSLVVDIGSNDGVTLAAFAKHGVPAVGVEPAQNLADWANSKNLATIPAYFDDPTCREIITRYGKKPDLILASNSFAHADELLDMAHLVKNLLSENGTFIIEVQYLLDTIQQLNFDNIYHEHYNYWMLASLIELTRRADLQIIGVSRIDTHGGSIRVFIQRTADIVPDQPFHFLNPARPVREHILEEHGLLSYPAYRKFGEKIEQSRQNVIQNIRWLASRGSPIIGYGAPAKATTALNYFGIDSTYIEYVIEDNPLKQGKYIPGVNIPIRSKNELEFSNKPHVFILIMAWNFEKEIIKNNSHLNGGNVTFLTIYDLRKSPNEFVDFLLLREQNNDN